MLKFINQLAVVLLLLALGTGVGLLGGAIYDKLHGGTAPKMTTYSVFFVADGSTAELQAKGVRFAGPCVIFLGTKAGDLAICTDIAVREVNPNAVPAPPIDPNPPATRSF